MPNGLRTVQPSARAILTDNFTSSVTDRQSDMTFFPPNSSFIRTTDLSSKTPSTTCWMNKLNYLLTWYVLISWSIFVRCVLINSSLHDIILKSFCVFFVLRSMFRPGLSNCLSVYDVIVFEKKFQWRTKVHPLFLQIYTFKCLSKRNFSFENIDVSTWKLLVGTCSTIRKRLENNIVETTSSPQLNNKKLVLSTVYASHLCIV